jgi:hypothetical protein
MAPARVGAFYLCDARTDGSNTPSQPADIFRVDAAIMAFYLLRILRSGGTDFV